MSSSCAWLPHLPAIALLLGATTFSLSCTSDAPDDENVEAGEGLSEGDLEAAKVVYETQLRGFDMAAKELHLTLDDGPGARTGELAKYLQGLAANCSGNDRPRRPRYH
jgi:hypothetical protein